MDLKDFESDLDRQVISLCDEYDIEKDRAFLIWAGERILDIPTEDAFTAASLGGTNDLCLDFGYVDEDTETVLLAQGKYSDSVSRDAIRGLRDVPEILADPKKLRDRKARQEVMDFGRRFRLATRSGFQTRLAIIHLGKIAVPTRGELEGTIQDYGSAELRELQERRSPVIVSTPPERIAIRVPSSMFFQLEDRPGRARCVIVGVPLTELHRLFHTHGAGMLDRNVRLFVGKRTPANKGMMSTLETEKERDNFFFYNNGLCFLVSKIGKPTKQGDSYEIPLEWPQIVNGGQTYFTVGSLDEDKLGDATVLARIMCPPGGAEGANFVDNIIRATNTQTPVTSRDFKANDPIQKKLFEMFSHLDPPWFYERKVGLWDALDAKYKVRFKIHSPVYSKFRFRVIDNEELAKCILSWNGRPGLPRTRGKKIFEDRASEEGLYSEAFPPDCANDAFVHDALVAYELDLFLQLKRLEWIELKKKAREAGDDATLKSLERDGFLPFFNYYAIACFRYIADRYYPGEDTAALLEGERLAENYDFLLRTFRFVIENARKRDQAAGKIFNFTNWFKQESSFTEDLQSAIENNMAFSKFAARGQGR